MKRQAASSLPADQKILIGRPASMLDGSTLNVLRRIAYGVPGCIEAHLPQVFVLGAMPASKMALTLVIDGLQDPQQITQQLNDEIARSLPASSIDTWLLIPSDSILTSVRSARCALL